MPTARRGPTEFVNEPGNGLDSFGSEGASLLELVEAYPEPELHPPASLRRPREALRLPVTFHHRAASTVRSIRTAMLFPFVVVAWFTLRVWWLIRLTLSGIGHAITAGVSLVGVAIIASGRGVRNLVVGTVRLPVRAVMAVVLTVRAAVYGTGRAIVHGAMLVRSATLAVAHGIAAAIAFVAGTIARAVMAVVLTVRAAVYGTGRAIVHGAMLIRSATLAVAHGIAAAIAFVARTIARAVMAVVLTVRTAVYGTGRAIVHGAMRVRSATLAVAHGVAAAIAFVAGTIARAVIAVVLTVRAAVYGTGRAIVHGGMRVRSATLAAAHGVAAAIAFVAGTIARAVIAVRAAVYGTGRAIVHGGMRVRSATLAAAHGVAAAIAFVAGTIARAVIAVVLTVRAAVYGTGRAIVHGGMRVRSATLAAAHGIAAAIAFVAAMIARTTASLIAFGRTSVRVTVTALAAGWSGVVSAVTAAVLAVRAGVAGIGRAVAHSAMLIRSATLAVARGIAGAIAFVAAMIARTVASVMGFARTSVRVTVTALAAVWIGVVNGVSATARRCAVAVAFGAGAITRSAAGAIASARTRGRATVMALVSGYGRLAAALTARAFAARAKLPAARSGIGDAVTRRATVIRSATQAAARRLAEALALGVSLAARLRVSLVARRTLASRPSVAVIVPRWARPARLVPVLALVVAVGVGTTLGVVMLLLAQRPGQRVAAAEPAAPPLSVAPSSVVTAVAAAPVDPTAGRRRTTRPVPVPRPAVSTVAATPASKAPRSLSAARVRAIWSKTDTRSLDRALTSLRSTTLAFQRCQMRMTADDRAVAQCDERAGAQEAPIQVAWTIDFRRDEGRWLIDGLSSTRPRPAANR